MGRYFERGESDDDSDYDDEDDEDDDYEEDAFRGFAGGAMPFEVFLHMMGARFGNGRWVYT